MAPDTELIYNITSEADDHLNDVARQGHEITQDDIKQCVTAWVKCFVPDDASKQERLIPFIIEHQFKDWHPNDE